MCIRDRAEANARLLDARNRADAAEKVLADTPAIAGRGIAPVSYTHLRAHETVLDLVCRLLLEKKQT